MNELAAALLELAKARKIVIATVESCTGGMVAAALTSVPGSSAVFDRGWTTYSNLAKHQEVGVSWDALNTHGAVSEPVAVAMAEGALLNSAATMTVAVTGIAGPEGGSPDKPVGLVHFACAKRYEPTLHRRHVFSGNRDEIRRHAAITALSLLKERLL